MTLRCRSKHILPRRFLFTLRVDVNASPRKTPKECQTQQRGTFLGQVYYKCKSKNREFYRSKAYRATARARFTLFQLRSRRCLCNRHGAKSAQSCEMLRARSNFSIHQPRLAKQKARKKLFYFQSRVKH
jgi:hypothetical protein